MQFERRKTDITKIKLCGITRAYDIEAVNELQPEFIGFVFAEKSKRRLNAEQARQLKQMLSPSVKAAGVFVNEAPERIAELFEEGVIDLAQLHGDEDEHYIDRLRALTSKPIIQAFRIANETDLKRASESKADYILLDSGAGTGKTFDWNILKGFHRPYLLAGGLSSDNVGKAIKILHPYAVDVSSLIETDGVKDKNKMAAFVAAVRKGDTL